MGSPGSVERLVSTADMHPGTFRALRPVSRQPARLLETDTTSYRLAHARKRRAAS